MNDEPSTGNCFVVAAHLALGLRGYGEDDDVARGLDRLKMLEAENPELVHGVVTRRQDGRQHTHAWVEADVNGEPLVFDFANGLDVTLPPDVYYALGEIHDVWRYGPDAAREAMLAHEHYGPWPTEGGEA